MTDNRLFFTHVETSIILNALQASCCGGVFQQKSAGQVSCQGLATEVMQLRLTYDSEPIIFLNSVREPIRWGQGGTTGRQSPEIIF